MTEDKVSCNNRSCYNFDKTRPMYCDKCIQREIDKMSDDEIADMYAEGKEWIDGIKYDPNDPVANDMIDKFKAGWFSMLNIVLLSRTEK